MADPPRAAPSRADTTRARGRRRRRRGRRRRAWSPPGPPARPSPPPCSGSAAGRGAPPGPRRHPARRRRAGGAARRRRAPSRPGRATLARHAALGAAYAAVVARRRRAPGSACSPSAPSPARATGCAGPPTAVLAALDLPGDARYVGLVEGNDVVTGARADVVVTDGFTGNVLLKGIEGAYAAGPAARRPATARRGPRPCSASPARSSSATAPPTGDGRRLRHRARRPPAPPRRRSTAHRRAAGTT